MAVAETTLTPAVVGFENPTAVKDLIVRYLQYSIGTTTERATTRDFFHAVSLAVRQALLDAMEETDERARKNKAKRIYYLSMEFLMGKSLENNLINLGLYDVFSDALSEFDIELQQVIDHEPDAGLGNGGLGRLAACFVDSMATLGLAGYGYGINYEYGLFKQRIHHGWQREQPDNWQADGTPWQVERHEDLVIVPVFGRIENNPAGDGEYNPMWVDWQAIVGVPHDMPVAGYEGKNVNFLRLYSARGSNEFDMDVFNDGDYFRAVEQKIQGETISKVLYPSDAVESGRELRLIQEYFLVACSIRDLIRRHETEHGDLRTLADSVAIQMNDTHPALAVPELMRLLVDEKDFGWDEAWEITTDTLAYTNHTLLPEALEKWPVSLVERVLPRHLQIIFEINHRFLRQVAEKWPGQNDKPRAMSIIEEGHEQQVRMCNLAIVGSHSVNGVSALHSNLIKTNLVPDFYALWPEKFNNKTNGITPRRWLVQSNPTLTSRIKDAIGSDWITDLDKLRALETFANDAAFQDDFNRIKEGNKRRLAETILIKTGVTVNPGALFDVQVKRIHEYKRQLLNAMRIIHDYYSIVEDGVYPDCPRTYIFAGKAAPGYWAAKQIIGLINQVANVVNRDAKASEWMQVVFLPNYRVSQAELIYPASDISEQISTAGFEASGTSNMKFALNGALTMGTLDGANVEILEEVGEENIFIFGLTAEQIQEWYTNGGPAPYTYYDENPVIRRTLDALQSDRFSPWEAGAFNWIREKLLADHDPYFHLADFDSYIRAQADASRLFSQKSAWAEKAILNVARIGKFSSDRTIAQYASEIWGAEPIS